MAATVSPASVTVPKSMADRESAEWLSRPPPQTMCAIGKYAKVAHRPVKTIQVPNFTRPASAPEISAVEITANVSWKPTSMMLAYPEAPAT